MEVILIRHGQSYANENGLLISDDKDNLTELGRRQAALLASNLSEKIKAATKLYSSPWQRAKTTAEILFADRMHEIEFDSRIIETLPGIYGTWTELEFNLKYPDFHLDIARKYENGESHLNMYERVSEWVDEKLLQTPEVDELIICVSHGGPITAMLQYILGIPINFYPMFSVPNASFTRLLWNKTYGRYCATSVGVPPLSI